MGSKSVIVENEHWSVISGDQAEARHHLIFGTGKRDLAEEDGLWIPLTADEHTTGELIRRLHDNPMAESLSKIAGQLAWESEYYRKAAQLAEFSARRAFRLRYGNLTFNFTKSLRRAHASAQWYVDRSINRERENVKNRINAELSGCWRCSGREKNLCECCEHKAEAERLSKLL